MALKDCSKCKSIIIERSFREAIKVLSRLVSVMEKAQKKSTQKKMAELFKVEKP